jgi:hypothetical protein
VRYYCPTATSGVWAIIPEKWTKDGTKVDRMLYAGSSLDKARQIFTAAIEHRPRIRLTIRQQIQVLEQWPVVRP